jgi:hypothetical protein
MSADLERLEAKLAELENDYAALVSTLTREDATRKATDYSEAARRDEVAALILNGHAHGEPLQRVLNAYTASGSKLSFDEWLIETAQSVEGITLTNKQRDSRLRKLATELDALKQQHLEARKAAAMAQLEAEFAGTGEAA